MGTLRHQGSSPHSHPRPLEYLYQNHSIGRAPSCQLILDHRVISGHHATIRWVDGTWTLRDLGSRNGTFLNGRRLAGGSSHWPEDLAEGDQIMFTNHDESWVLVDASEPRPLLVPLDDERPPIELDNHDVLALPAAERPLVTLYRDQNSWWIEREGECAMAHDRQQIELDGRSYRLLITDDLDPTNEVESLISGRRVEDMLLDIEVTPDEESATATARVAGERRVLPQRTFLYLLAFLARRRLAEAAERGLDAGWVSVETVCRELQLKNAEGLTVLVHRCRKAIKASGVEDPAAIIDRSRRGRLRIGVDVARLSVTCARG